MNFKVLLPMFLALTMAFAFIIPNAKNTPSKPSKPASTNIYDYSYKDLHTAEIVSISKYKGRKILFVNTASLCGNTPQYAGLEKLYEKYKGNLVIVGFPSNDFGQQEPGSNDSIAHFCKLNYGVSFPMSQKIEVKGAAIDPIYSWLTSKALNGKMDSEVKWNFQKYLVDEKGNFVTFFAPKTQPMADEVVAAIEHH